MVKLHSLNEAPDAETRVFFLHGFMGSPLDWQEIATALGRNAQCISVALPGHGGSEITPTEPSEGFEGILGAFGDALEDALARDLPSKKTVIVGYSMGGRVALYLALRHPEKFAGALIESATPGIPDTHARQARAAHDAAIAQTLSGMNSEAEFRAFLTDWYNNPPFDTLNDEHRAELIEARLANSPQQLATSLMALSVGGQPDLWPELENLKCPVLVVCGEKDSKYRQIAEEMAARSPQVAVQVMADCGHNVHFEQPAAYTTVLRGFLDGVK